MLQPTHTCSSPKGVRLPPPNVGRVDAALSSMDMPEAAEALLPPPPPSPRLKEAVPLLPAMGDMEPRRPSISLRLPLLLVVVAAPNILLRLLWGRQQVLRRQLVHWQGCQGQGFELDAESCLHAFEMCGSN